MTMPIDLVLVRHGESEGNVANCRSRRGNNDAFTTEFLARHSSRWRLTDKGIYQAQIAGDWIRNNISERFDRYYVSEYLRAMETASYLNFEDAKWYVDFYLRERDIGQLDVMSDEERRKRFAEELSRQQRDGFFWAPPGGESLANVSLRLDRVFNTLHRECSDKKVVIVCHGEVIWTFRVKLERMSQERFCELDKSNHPHNRIHNCQVLHYTRRNPETGQLMPYMHWMRSICPTDTSLSNNEWETIVRPKYSNWDLLREVKKEKRVITK